jgi:formylglycine-generating enzyme required for sulfatase activity
MRGARWRADAGVLHEAAQTAVYRTGDLDLANGCVNWNAGYRLATEAEWEKAARGGLSGQRFPWGNTISESQANYYSYNGYSYDLSPTLAIIRPLPRELSLHESGGVYFAPNGYGLYDMAGNVWQWCWDWYGTYAGAAIRVDLHQAPTVCFGAAVGTTTRSTAGRRFATTRLPGLQTAHFGFRSVLPPGQ